MKSTLKNHLNCISSLKINAKFNHWSIMALFFCSILLNKNIYSQGSQTFGASGGNGFNAAGAYTFTVPIGVTAIKVTVRGGGGGGGANFTNANGAGGGGGGGVAILNNIPATAGSTFNLFVGAEGAGGVGGGNGGNGGQSWFINSTTLFANGGIGGIGVPANSTTPGQGSAGGTAGGSLANLSFTGGSGGPGNSNPLGAGGGAGSSAGTSANGNDGQIGTVINDPILGLTAVGGLGGLAPIGGFSGGAGGAGGNGSGKNGGLPGGGGGGTGDIQNTNVPIGGIGRLGQVVIEWTCPNATISLPPIICKNVSSILPTFAGSLGGAFVASPAGLSINPLTGEINATTSTANNYRVEYLIEADRGCPRVNPRADIIINPLVTATLTSQVNIACKGASTGSVVITPGGGVIQGGGNPPVYNITPAQTGLSAGIHVFTVTDARGCTATTSANITEPSNGLTASETHIDIPCYNGPVLGVATISATGGVPPYIGIGTFSNLAVGNHIFVVTDFNNCTSSVTVTISQPVALLSVVANNQVNVLCKGANTGSVEIVPSGGTAPYSISPAQNNLTAGLKIFTVTDANGCTANIQVTISEPDLPLQASATNLINVKCKGDATGSVEIIPSGGAGGYMISPSQTGLTAGLKTFTITDANGCSTTLTVNILEPSAPLSISLTSQINVLCKGAATGAVTLLPGGGTPSYIISPSQTNLTAGLKTFTVTDQNSCITTIQATITEPDLPLTASFNSVNNVICRGTATGSVDIIASGGTAPYTISPSQTGLTVGLKTFTITDANNCTTTLSIFITEPAQALSVSSSNQVNILCKGAATGSVVILPAGGVAPYSISPQQTALTAGLKIFTVTDFNGCTATISITIQEPAEALSASITGQTNVLCKGGNTGSVQITPTGGVAPYTISPSQINLTAGNKVFTVTDANGCIFSQNVLITEPSSPLVATILSQINVSCFGGTNGEVVIQPTGGTGPYTISPTQTALTADNYSFTVTDANSCSTSVLVTITQPAPISISNTLVYIPINSSASLSANCGVLTTKWYDASGANLLFTGQNYNTNPLSQNTVFKVRCENVDCVNSFVDVNVKIGIISLKTGNWEDPTAWSANRTPTATDDVVIDTGHTISVNSANANAKKLHFNLNGNLKFANTTSKLILFQ